MVEGKLICHDPIINLTRDLIQRTTLFQDISFLHCDKLANRHVGRLAKGHIIMPSTQMVSPVVLPVQLLWNKPCTPNHFNLVHL